MEQLPSIVFIALIVSAVMLIAELFDFLSECVNTWFYQRKRKRFKAEVDAGKQPDWIPCYISNDGSTHIDPEDLLHTATYKQFKDFSKRNQ